VKSKVLSALKMIFFLGIGVLLVWLVMRQLTEKDKQDIIQAFKSADYTWIILTLVLNMASNVSRAIRWQMLIRPSGHKPSFINTFAALMIGYLANFAVPRLGEVTRCGVLNKYEKVPVSISLGTVVLERVIDVISLGVLLVATILWKHALIADFLNEVYLKLTGGSSNSVVKYYVIGTVLLIGCIAYIFRKKLFRHAIFQKIGTFITGFWNGLIAIKDLERPWMFLFHSIFIWVMYLMTLYVGFLALTQTAGLPFDAAMVALAFGTFGMILVQGGLGAYPVFVSKALALYQVPEAIGFAYGWLAWVTQTIMYVLIGVVALIFMPVLNRQNAKG
jgi:glycosyltransferase 2 family protein